MIPERDSQLVLLAPELRHLAVLLEMLGASVQDLVVECGTQGYKPGGPSQLAAFDLIAAMRTLCATIRRYRRIRRRELRTPPLDERDI